jgi:hypothetical protein
MASGMAQDSGNVRAVVSQAICGAVRPVLAAQRRGRSGREARRIQRAAWPDEVRAGRGVFTSHRMLTGLRALGLPVAQVRFEVRSRKGVAGVWVMLRGLGNPIAHGRTLSEATAALVRLIDPTVETVNDVNGMRLA